METTVVTIKGMTCMGCVRSVTNILQGIAGVSSVAVSLEQAQATIQYDAAKTGVNQLKTAITEAGYEVVG